MSICTLAHNYFLPGPFLITPAKYLLHQNAKVMTTGMIHIMMARIVDSTVFKHVGRPSKLRYKWHTIGLIVALGVCPSAHQSVENYLLNEPGLMNCKMNTTFSDKSGLIFSTVQVLVLCR